MAGPLISFRSRIRHTGSSQPYQLSRFKSGIFPAGAILALPFQYLKQCRKASIEYGPMAVIFLFAFVIILKYMTNNN
ncbi:MAG: hypothetical protein ACNA7H_08345, partial [Desulfotignum sp.]